MTRVKKDTGTVWDEAMLNLADRNTPGRRKGIENSAHLYFQARLSL